MCSSSVLTREDRDEEVLLSFNPGLLASLTRAERETVEVKRLMPLATAFSAS